MANVALNKSASSNMSVAPFTPNQAVDGAVSAADRWVGTVPGWLQVDLGYTYWIDQWTVKNPAVIANWDRYIMKNYKLQGSNDLANWTDISSVTGNGISTTQIPIAPTRFRYFRIYVTDGLAVNSPVSSIVEMELNEYSNPPYLSNLVPSVGSLNPAFNKQVFNYTVSAAQNVTEMYVTPSTTAAGAAITVNGQTVNNSSPSQNITLSEGITTITTRMSVNSGMLSETYTITVAKDVSPYLENLIINGAVLSEMFDPEVTSYVAYVNDGEQAVTVIPYTQTPNARVNVNGMTVNDGQPSGKIDTPVGTTMISVYVENASPRITYQIEAQRYG